MESEALSIDPVHVERLLFNIRTAVAIKTRPQFFSWVQGTFQGFLAHEVLICALACPPAGALKFDWIASYPIAEDRFRELSRPDEGLLRSLVKTWEQGGHEPILLGGPAEPGAPPEAEWMLGEIERFDLRNVAADGFAGLDGKPWCFFAFFKLSALDGPHTRHVLRMWLPHLYAAWLHAACGEPDPVYSRADRIHGVLTRREVEILNWVGKGKTNGQIARLLGIGEPTIATHLERMFRKLGVSTRAEAVAKGMTLNLQQGRGPGWRYY